MIKRIQGANVVTKLLVSFTLVIMMFLGVAIYSNLLIRNMDFLYRYRIHNMEARNVLLLELHQELTEFRRLLKASYYHPTFVDESDARRRVYENFIEASHVRLNDLARRYIDSVYEDELLDEYLEGYESHELISLMWNIKDFADEVFVTFRDNFFIGGNDSGNMGNVLDLTPRIEDYIRHLREIDSTVDDSIRCEIEAAISLNQTVTVITLLLALVFAILLAFITIKSLSNWVRHIENAAIESLQHSSIAEANSQAKSRFLARMSHEIRTPVSAVIGVAEIQLQKTDLPKDVEDAFNRVYTSSSVLFGILNDILDLSKIEAGKMDIFLAEYDTVSLIQDVLQMHVVELDTKKFKFKVNIDKTLPAALVGDVLRLKQVFNNVLSNAFKYTEVGTVEFSVRCVDHPDSSMINLVVEIRDTGRGMTSEQVERILKEEYTRFHEGEVRNVVGTGLGMPIVLSLMELMNAHIDIKSHVKAGTRVTLQIPQKVATMEEIGAKAATSLSKLKTVTKKLGFNPTSLPHGKVLVVDDVETNLFVAKGLLGLYDMQISTLDNAVEAIDRIKCGEVYDIIFMDHMMPELNGMDATKILRDLGYTKPIVALTANALVGQAEVFLSNGFDDFIAKPIQTRYLHQVVTKYITDPDAPPDEDEDETDDFPTDVSEYYDTPEVISMVREEFSATQRDAPEKLRAALAEGEMEKAQRISHTLKSIAHMMKEEPLSAAARAVESAIYKRDTPTEEQLSALETEMEKVLAMAANGDDEAVATTSNESDGAV